MRTFDLFFSLRGRIDRSTYIVGLGLGVFLAMALAAFARWGAVQLAPVISDEVIMPALVVPIGMAFFYVVFALSAKRLHDLGEHSSRAFLLMVPLGNLILVKELIEREGSSTQNEFGPAPGR